MTAHHRRLPQATQVTLWRVGRTVCEVKFGSNTDSASPPSVASRGCYSCDFAHIAATETPFPEKIGGAAPSPLASVSGYQFPPTLVGTSLLVVVPSPSWPYSFHPQQYTLLASVKPQV